MTTQSRRQTLVWLLAISIPSSLATTSRGEEPGFFPIMRLDQIPLVKLEVQKELAEARQKEIDELIESLKELDTADVGLLGVSPLDTIFLPVGSFGPFGERRLDDKFKPLPAIEKLVRFGPTALPALLKSLDDTRLTKLLVKVDGELHLVKTLWFDDGLSGNPLNPVEQATLRLGRFPWQESRDGHDEVGAYRVKLGDVCLTVIGQIVGRDYHVLYYDGFKPSGAAICSPTHSRKVCSQVRSIWKSDDARKRLFDSLLLDYSTRGMYDGGALDDWDRGNNIQIRATMRLLYYFPKESVPLIAQRLDRLDVFETEDFGDQCARNGVRPNNFIDAVSWCQDAAIQAALQRMSKRAKDHGAVQALERAKIVLAK